MALFVALSKKLDYALVAPGNHYFLTFRVQSRLHFLHPVFCINRFRFQTLQVLVVHLKQVQVEFLAKLPFKQILFIFQQPECLAAFCFLLIEQSQNTRKLFEGLVLLHFSLTKQSLQRKLKPFGLNMYPPALEDG